MSMHFFSIPALDSDGSAAQLRAFCQRERVLGIERHLVVDGAHSFWAICVTVAPGPGPLPSPVTQRGATRAGKEGAIDYKLVLSEADFAVFAALRSLRKTLAERDGVPLYAVLTNQQLAAIAQQRCSSAAQLAEVEGFGPARLERYATAVLACVAEAHA